ncbi:MAG: glutaminase A [Zoogloea sp.]|uniref:glutaminase A n=1 Tax=Zoogloea sp. TaxID=49181 RepID=UPI003F2CDF9E
MQVSAENLNNDPIQIALQQAYENSLSQTGGALADYIPELARVDPERFGLALATAKGRLYTVGDVDIPFTIQSVSKAFSYCLALELVGAQEVRSRVGVEPSGDAFNAIEFDPVTRRPFNPMVNAGAITVAGVLRDVYGAQAFEKVLEKFSLAANRPLDLDESVYRSEAETGHRNRAIAHLLRASGALAEPVEDAVDLYFRLCSIRVTARDLAVMAATLANMGENPFTGTEVFDLRAVRDTLAVMFSCGMYDYSGNWICDVGIPAKSGVGGGLIGVVNRQLGLGAFSPRLDEKGNSVRGVNALQWLSNELGLHTFECTNSGSSFVEQLLA